MTDVVSSLRDQTAATDRSYTPSLHDALPIYNWRSTPNSGAEVLGVANSGTFGSLASGAVEASNVDMSAELVNMIVAQRNYQSNSQTIKTQDQILNTLVNLR